jgi:hypothetical protein
VPDENKDEAHERDDSKPENEKMGLFSSPIKQKGDNKKHRCQARIRCGRVSYASKRCRADYGITPVQ